MSINIQKILESMKKYLDISSPTGNTKETILEIQKNFEKIGFHISMHPTITKELI